MWGNTLVRLAVSAWLVYVAVADVRKGEVSNWFTVPPLLAVVAWRSWTGGYVLGLALLGLFFLDFLEQRGASRPTLVVLTGALLGPCLYLAVPAGLEIAVGAWALGAVLYRLGIFGGADVKVVMALVALYPDDRLAWLLLLVWIVVDVSRLVCRYGRGAGGALVRALRTLAFLPAGGVEGTEAPFLPIATLAGLAYVLLIDLR